MRHRVAKAAAGGGWTPASLSGLALWLDASNTGSITSSGGAVSQWDDLSGNARHHTQATAGSKPTTGTRTLNGLNVLDFDGTDDWLSHTWTAVAQPLTVAAVFQSDAGVSGRIFGRGVAATFTLGRTAAAWQYAAGTARNAGTADTSAHSLVGCYDGTASRLRLDKTQIHDGTAASPGTAGITAALHSVGARDDNTIPWDGAIAELIIVSSNLDGTGDLTSLESYLSTKWGTP